MTYVRLKDSNLIFFGANFTNEFPAKNLYKALNVAKPDSVLVQMAPNYLLSKFNMWPEKYNNETSRWEFDQEKYLRQLKRPGYELYPSLKSKIKMIKLLKQSGIIVGNKSEPDRDLNEEIVRYQNYLTKKNNSVRVSKKALTTVATWAEMHNSEVVLAEVPSTLHKYNVLQDYHLLDL